MIEELIRIEHGSFRHAETEYAFDVSVSRGECIGVYVDNHRTSGTACIGIFTGQTKMTGGRAFSCGRRTGYLEMQRWIRSNSMVIDRHRYETEELTAYDFLTALGTPAGKGFPDSPEAGEIRDRMRISFPLDRHLTDLSMLDYYRLAAYKAWVTGRQVVVLDRITEILRRQDLIAFMRCVEILMEQGIAVLLLDLDENFMFRYAKRIDILKNGRLCYRLYPEEYGDRLYDILGWSPAKSEGRRAGRRGLNGTARIAEDRLTQARFTQARIAEARPAEDRFRAGGKTNPSPCLTISNLTFDGLTPMNFELGRGEIGLMQDENYRTASCVRDCFLGKEGWTDGAFCLDGRSLSRRDLQRQMGKDIALQIEMPDRADGVLFDNLSALENLAGGLIPKAGKHLVRKHLMNSVLNEAAEWFDREALLEPIRKWPMPERLRLSYYKWYLLNPRLLICLFPFLGQESLYHEMIVDLLVLCARRGMAVWIISSGIDAICEKTRNREFLRRVRFLD